MQFVYDTQGTCSVQIIFELEGDKVHNISFIAGCNGNLKAISKLCEGMSVSEIESYLLGNTCGSNTTSCADQLAKAVRLAYDRENKN